MTVCVNCNKEKELNKNNFRAFIENDKIYFSKKCLNCINKERRNKRPKKPNIFDNIGKDLINLYLFEGFNISDLSKKYNIHSSTISRFLEKNNIKKKTKSESKTKLIIKNNLKYKKCSKCLVLKELNVINFIFRKTKNKFEGSICRCCVNKKKSERNKREDVRIKRNKYKKKRRKEKIKDPIFKLRSNISSLISSILKKRNTSKNKNSFSKYFLYSINQLKNHLENQFEPWMSWNNYGKYNSKTWDDSDSSTWTWNIDHIIPQSTFEFNSMEDDEFKKCWSLENLRPYSAKLNIIEGSKRTRHKNSK